MDQQVDLYAPKLNGVGGFATVRLRVCCCESRRGPLPMNSQAGHVPVCKVLFCSLSARLSVYLSVRLALSLSVSDCWSVCLCVCVSDRLFDRLSVCVGLSPSVSALL